MARALAYLGQAIAYLGIAALLGVFADTPAYTSFPADKAQLLLSFTHGAQRKGECRRLTSEEIAALAPNMRRPTVCPRERLPVLVELELDGTPLFRASLPPTGFSGDGPSQVYQRFVVEPGRYRLVVRLRDSAREQGFDYERAAEVVLAPRQKLVIDFRSETGGFIFAAEPQDGARARFAAAEPEEAAR